MSSGLLLNPDWINRYLLQALIAEYSLLALVSVAMTFAIIASNVDLSPGSMIGLSGAVIGLVFTWTGNIWASACSPGWVPPSA